MPPSAVSVYKRRRGRFSRAEISRVFPSALEKAHVLEPAQRAVEGAVCDEQARVAGLAQVLRDFVTVKFVVVAGA